MSDQEKKQETNISPQPDAEDKKQASELSEEELKKVSGGRVQLSEIPVVKHVDNSTP